MLISAIEGLITFVFEIPAGILADVWGKKRTVLAGMLMGVAGLAAYVIHPSFAVFVVAEPRCSLLSPLFNAFLAFSLSHF